MIIVIKDSISSSLDQSHPTAQSPFVFAAIEHMLVLRPGSTAPRRVTFFCFTDSQETYSLASSRKWFLHKSAVATTARVSRCGVRRRSCTNMEIWPQVVINPRTRRRSGYDDFEGTCSNNTIGRIFYLSVAPHGDYHFEQPVVIRFVLMVALTKIHLANEI